MNASVRREEKRRRIDDRWLQTVKSEENEIDRIKERKRKIVSVS